MLLRPGLLIIFLSCQLIGRAQAPQLPAELQQLMQLKEQDLKDAFKAAEQKLKDAYNGNTGKQPVSPEEKKPQIVEGEPELGDAARDSIRPTPSSFAAFKMLIDKTVKELELSLPAEIVAESQNLRDQLQTSGKIGEVSVARLSQGDMLSAAMLSGYSVQADYNDVNALSALSGILNICGHPAKSIPILEYSAASSPNLNTYNNLGDAYRRMGKWQTAQAWLNKAVAMEPYEIEANLLLGQLAMKNGQSQQAMAYFTASLQGGYTTEAESYLKLLKKEAGEDVSIGEILLSTHKREPLNEMLPVKCPELPLNVESIASTWLPKQQTHIAGIKKYNDEIQAGTQESTMAMINQYMQQMQDRQPSNSTGIQISTNKSYLIVSHLLEELVDDLRHRNEAFGSQIAEIDDQRKKDMSELDKAYHDAMEAQCRNVSDPAACEREVGQQYCTMAHSKLMDYLGAYSRIYEDYCTKAITSITGFYNTGAKWAYTAFLPEQRNFGRLTGVELPIIGFVQDVTENASILARLDLYANASCCDPNDLPDFYAIPASPPSVKVLPVFPGDNVCTNVQVPLFVGGLQMDCRGYSLELFGASVAFESDEATSAVESIFPETSRTTIKFGKGIESSNVGGTGGKAELALFFTLSDDLKAYDFGVAGETGLTFGGLAVGQQNALKLGVTSGGTFMTTGEPDRKLFTWKDQPE